MSSTPRSWRSGGSSSSRLTLGLRSFPRLEWHLAGKSFGKQTAGIRGWNGACRQRRQPPHPQNNSLPSATFAGVVGLSGGAPAERGRGASIPWVPTSMVRERRPGP